MIFRPYRRTQRRWPLRVIFFLLPTALLLDLSLILRAHSTFRHDLLGQTVINRKDLPSVVQQQKIFIAAQFWTSEYLLTHHWTDAFLQLVQILSPDNIYVSIISSHSLDNTNDAVGALDARLAELNVPRTIILDPTSHKDAISVGHEDSFGNPRPGWVMTDDTGGSTGKERRRIPYLSDLRNRGLEPLEHLRRTSGRIFDRILYLNDVVFEPKDILTLLATNGGDFDVACGLDYHLPPNLYDSFAVRDMSFRGPITSVFPYFVGPATLSAMLAGSPAPVPSCWNGLVAADATPYYNRPSPGPPGQIQRGLQFRGIPDSLAAYFVEASECCLVHADLLASGQARRGIYVNPAVRTAYVAYAYEATHHGPLGSNFVNMWQYWSGIWVIRFRRWVKDAVSISAGQNMQEVYRRIQLWEQEETGQEQPRKEVGAYCITLEMQILISNGWKHVTSSFGKPELRDTGMK